MLRPNGEKAHTLTQTQFIHEWVTELRARGYQITDVGRGRPSFPADRDAVKALAEYANKLLEPDSAVLYGSSATGQLEYRAMAANGLSVEYGIEILPDNIIFTPGGQFGLAAAFYVVQRLAPNSAIITPCPWYVNHHDIARMFLPTEGTNRFAIHGKSYPPFVPIDVLADGDAGGKVTPENLEAAIKLAKKQKRKIGAFMFTNPANPLGTVMRKADWLKLVPILEAHPETPILLDEAFFEIVYQWGDADFSEAERFETSLLHAAPQLKDRCIVFRSGTKALALSGERMAVTISPKQYVGSLTAFQSRFLGNSPISQQCAMAAALEKMTYQKKRIISDYYQRNMQQLWQGLETLNLTIRNIPKPEGCFYTLADLRVLFGKKMPDLACYIMELPHGYKIETDMQLVISLMTGLNQEGKQGLAMMPACSFGMDEKRGIVRISASVKKEDIDDTLFLLQQVLKK